jgi:hypothetical protein
MHKILTGREILGVLIAAAMLVILAGLATPAMPAQAASGHHGTTWGQVLRHCHRTHACHRVPAGVRRFYGIAPGDPARIQYGDTTVTWWLHDGHVHRAVS